MTRTAYALLCSIDRSLQAFAHAFVRGYVRAGGAPAAEKLREAIDEGLRLHELVDKAIEFAKRWRSDARELVEHWREAQAAIATTAN